MTEHPNQPHTARIAPAGDPDRGKSMAIKHLYTPSTRRFVAVLDPARPATGEYPARARERGRPSVTFGRAGRLS